MNFLNNLGTIFDIASSVVGTAAMVAAVIPKAQSAVPILKGIRQVIDLLAFNVGNAKNQK